MNSRNIICFLWLFVYSITGVIEANAQKKRGITVYGTYLVEGGDVSDTQIEMLRNGVSVGTNNRGNGKFEYDLDFDQQYQLTFSQKGYITKKVVISTDVPERVLKANNKFPPFEIKITLYRSVPGGDYSIFDDPVAMIIYDKELDDFDYDRAYNAEIEEKIKKAEEQITKIPIPKIDEKSRLYEELIKKADREFESRSYVDARKTYQEAQSVKPKENYPKIRIELINTLLADLQKKSLEKERNESYYALVDKADILLEEKKYAPARSYYVEASGLKPEQQYPKDKIKLIDQIFAQKEAVERKYNNAISLGDRMFKEEKYPSAKTSYEEAMRIKEDENYPREQIERIERLLAKLESEKAQEALYKETIAKADTFFSEKNWYDAKDTYEIASGLKKDIHYPKQRIQEIERILKEEKNQLDNYTNEIARGDNAFEEKKWDNAKNYYKKALEFKPNEIYPQEQLKKIVDELKKIAKRDAQEKDYAEAIARGDRYFSLENWEEAKDSYFDALKLKSGEEYPKERIAEIEKKLEALSVKIAEDNRYNEALKIADNHYDMKKWNDALAQYKSALEIKPSEKYPKVQIRKVEDFLQQELVRQSEKEREDRYKGLIEEADKAYGMKDWNSALGSYEGALQIKSDANYPQSQILKIQELLRVMAEAERIQESYNSAVREADMNYQKSEWISAISGYEKAQSVKPEEMYPASQIEKIRQKIREEEIALQKALEKETEAKRRIKYDEVVREADNQFSSKEYAFAKHSYRKALTILPDEEYPQKQMKEIDRLLREKEEKGNKFYQNLNLSRSKKEKYYTPVEVKTKEKTRYIQLKDATVIDENKYNELIEKGEKAMSAGNYAFARVYFNQAYLIKPSPSLLNKIVQTRHIVSEKTD